MGRLIPTTDGVRLKRSNKRHPVKTSKAVTLLLEHQLNRHQVEVVVLPRVVKWISKLMISVLHQELRQTDVMVGQEEMEVIVVIVNHVTRISIGAVAAIANGMMAVAMVIGPSDKTMTINEVVATTTGTPTIMVATVAIVIMEIDALTIATKVVMTTGTLSKMTIVDHRDEHRVRRMIFRECAVEIVVVAVVVHHTIGIAVVVVTKNVVAAAAVMREMATVAETIIVTPVMVIHAVDEAMVHVIWMAVVLPNNRMFHLRMMIVKVNVFGWGRTSQNMKIQM